MSKKGQRRTKKQDSLLRKNDIWKASIAIANQAAKDQTAIALIKPCISTKFCLY
jgi:hypothetical protein